MSALIHVRLHSVEDSDVDNILHRCVLPRSPQRLAQQQQGQRVASDCYLGRTVHLLCAHVDMGAQAGVDIQRMEQNDEQ